MAASNKTLTILGASAVCNLMNFRRVTVNGVARIEAMVDGRALDNLGGDVELVAGRTLLAVGSQVETNVLALMNGAALVLLRQTNGLET